MSMYFPKNSRIGFLLPVLHPLSLAVVILLTFAPAPALLADSAPSFTSAASVTFPQGVLDTFTITTSGIPVSKITSSGKLPGGIRLTDHDDGTATLSGVPGNGLGLVGDY